MQKNKSIIAYNDHQNFLYNRALHGLRVYSQKEIEEMPLEKKQRVKKLHKKAQTVINLWKQEIVNCLANKLFTNIFPDMEITQCLVEYYGTGGDPEYINTMSFKTLGITKEDVINKLIESKLLPKNFYQLNHESRNNMQRRSEPANMSRKSDGRRDIKESHKTGK